MSRDTEKKYNKEIIYRDEIISIFAALIQPLQENAFPCAEDIFQVVSNELVSSSSAIEHIYLSLPTLTEGKYKSIDHNGLIGKLNTFRDTESVTIYFSEKHPDSAVKTKTLEISDQIQTGNAIIVEQAYLTYTSSNKVSEKRPRRLTSYDTNITDALEQLIKFTEKNNKDRMTGLMRRDVALIRMEKIIQSINGKGTSERSYKNEKRDKDNNKYNKLSLMFTDIDNFKTLNDKYGHEAGDVCLTAVAQKLKQNIKRQVQNSTDFGDIVTRWGGEEFLVILPQCDQKSARKIAEDIRKAVKGKPVEYKCDGAPQKIEVTISIGLVTLSLRDENSTKKFNLEDFDKLIKYADIMVYKAKYEGKDRTRSKSTTYDKLQQINLDREKTKYTSKKTDTDIPQKFK